MAPDVAQRRRSSDAIGGSDRGLRPGAIHPRRRSSNGGAPMMTEPCSAPSGPRSDAADARWCAWMAAAQAGDERAYQAVLRDCVPLIRAVARRQGVPADRSDDVVQDVLITVHQARHTYDPARSFRAWLTTLAQRRAIDFLRRNERLLRREVHDPFAYEAHADLSADPETGLDRASRLALVGRAIESLPQGQREAVEQLALAGHSLAEAAATTGRTAGALKVNLHRALKTLAERFGHGEFSGG